MILKAMRRRDRNHIFAIECTSGAFLFLATAAFVLWQNTHLTVLWDLSYILENADRMALGQMPYRDFPFPYAPLTFAVQAAIIHLFGHAVIYHYVYAAVTSGAGTVLCWRILRRLLRDAALPQRAVAFLLALPLVFLSTNSIFPHPFYDSDCTLFVLLCLWLLLKVEDAGYPAIGTFACGVLLAVPLFIKQNTGLAFLASAVVCAVWLAVRRQRAALALVAGATAGIAIGLALIQHTAGVRSYLHWTVEFAASRRLPGLSTMLGVYEDRSLLWPGVAFAVGIGLWMAGRNHSKNRKTREVLAWSSIALMSVSLLMAVAALGMQDNASDRVEALLRVWPLLLAVTLGAALWQAWRRPSMAQLVPLIVLGTVHGAFLSQQLWGSTYALWPLLMTLIAALLAGASEDIQQSSGHELTRPLTALAAITSVTLLICGGYYALSHERLDYVDLDGPVLRHSKLPALRGVAMRGEYLPQFEELAAYVEREIPRDDAILTLPGEDLFYYATGRTPRFPVILMDNTVNPYGAAQLAELARERNVRWVIVKRQLQLQEEPLAFRAQLLQLLARDYKRVESLDNYDIYRRK
jgi:4-amino-4-deoxy-L-arabinose transferase-like glycosyltransferase